MKLFRTPIIFRWIFPRRVWGFDRTQGKVYLTFDDGPTPELTRWIVDELNQHNIKATFFCVGTNAQQHPELIELLTNNGHVLGNHTMRHERTTEVTKRDYLSSIEDTREYVNSDLFRPPYGRLPMSMTKSVRKKYKIIMWTWLSYDFDESVSIKKIIEQTLRIKSGDILLVHDNGRIEDRLKVILPAIIKIVKEKKLSFDVIS